MNEKLRAHIDTLFEGAPQTLQTVEIKEEILQNTLERYYDLLAEGKSEEAAYNIAIAGIGDITDLLNSLRTPDFAESKQDQYRSGLLLSISVMLYILCIVPIILTNGNSLGVCLMLIMIAFATGLIIFRSKTRGSYMRQDDTMMESFKEWKSEENERRSVQHAINSTIFSLCLALYFIISFATGAWHITWVIFLISIALQNLVKACIQLKK